METNNFSFSNFSLNISDPYKDRGVTYVNYDFSSKLGDRYAYFFLCVDIDHPDYDMVPDCYDFSDYEVREAFEELFRTKPIEEIKDFFRN